MKSMKRILGLSLVGALIVSALAGCSTAAVQPTPDPGDIAYQTAAITRDTVLFTVSGEAVTAEEYLFWLYNSIESQKQAGGLADDAAWAGQIEDVAATDFLKTNAMETAKLYSIMQAKATAEGVTLTEEDKTDMQAQITQVTESLAEQGMTLQMWLDARCISEAGFTKLNEVYYLNLGLVAKLSAEGGVLAPTDEGMTAMLKESGFYNAKHILLSTVHRNEDGTTTAFSDEEKAATKKEADDLLAQIRASADPVATFDTIMNERSDDGRNEDGTLGAPGGYLSYPGQMVPEFETAAQALAVGEISEPVLTEHGYHIILALSADTEETRSYYPNYRMNQLIDEWVVAAKVETTPAYDSLNPKDFYEKLSAIAKDREDQAAASLTPSATPAPGSTPATGAPVASAPIPSATTAQ